MKDNEDYVIVNTTLPDEATAQKLAACIVENRLAACAQFFPIHSVYRWKGKIESAPEMLLLAKTRAALAARLVEFIRARHPYEVPEILVTPIIDGHAPYLDWLAAETT